MTDIKELSSKLTELAHDLFTVGAYRVWRESLSSHKLDRWYSLVVELDKKNIETEEVKKFGNDVYSKLVYRCVPSPNFKKTGEIMVLFNVSGWLWHSLICFSDARRPGG